MTQKEENEYKFLLKKKELLEKEIESLKKSSKIRDFDKEKYIEQDRENGVKCRKDI